jgi:hypothetical protein
MDRADTVLNPWPHPGAKHWNDSRVSPAIGGVGSVGKEVPNSVVSSKQGINSALSGSKRPRSSIVTSSKRYGKVNWDVDSGSTFDSEVTFRTEDGEGSESNGYRS